MTMMMDKNDIRHLSTPTRGETSSLSNLTVPKRRKKYSIDELLLTDMTYIQMSKLTGMSVYEIRRYTGSIQ